MKKILSSLLLMTVLLSILSLPVDALAYTSNTSYKGWYEVCRTSQYLSIRSIPSASGNLDSFSSNMKNGTFIHIANAEAAAGTAKKWGWTDEQVVNGKHYYRSGYVCMYFLKKGNPSAAQTTTTAPKKTVKKVDFALSGISKNSTVKLVVNSTLTLNPRMKTYYTNGTNTGWVDMKNGNGVLFSSSNTNVAWVSSTGKITAYKEGSATITVTRNGYSDQVKFTLKVTTPSAPSIQSICGSGCQVSLSWKKDRRCEGLRNSV